MQTKHLSRNLVWVVFSRVISLLSSVAVGLLLPKMFSVYDYGYFKVFTLYAVYMSLLHFGFVDGILLRLAGKEYGELDFEKTRTYTRFFIIFETLVSLPIILGGLIFARGEYLFIIIMLALNMVFVNVTTYYQFVSQATQRFREYSSKNLIVALVKLLFVIGLFIIYFLDVSEISYRVYLIGLNILDLSMAVWYVVIYRGITFGKGTPLSDMRKDIWSIFKIGFVLTMAYQVSHLVLALDRQFVNILFPVEDFAVYSFSYNIITMISTVISSLSIVLLPMLKRSSVEYTVGYYKKSISTVALVMSCALASYFPLVWFIEWFLPSYAGSLEYIAILLPALVFTSGITVVMFTIEKVLDRSFAFFKTGSAILILGFLANMAAYLIWKSPTAISYASLFVMAVWFIWEGISLGRCTRVQVYKEFIYISLISAVFLAVTLFVKSVVWGLLLYIVFLSALSLIMYFPLVKSATLSLVNKLRKRT